MKMKKILIAESNDFVRNMIASTFRNAGFETIAVNNDMEAINRASFSKPDAILIDSFVSRDIHHTVKFMKNHPSISRRIPIMVSTCALDEAFVNGALEAGAIDIIEKPFVSDTLVEKFSTLLNVVPYQQDAIKPLRKPSFVAPVTTKQSNPGVVTRKFQQIQYVMKLVKSIYEKAENLDGPFIQEVDKTVNRLVRYIFSGKRLPIINRNYAKDDSDYLYVHTVNKFFLSLMAAYDLGWKTEEAQHIGMAALLSDVGYKRIDQNILKKAGELTKEERKTVQSHVAETANLLSGLGLSEEIVETVAFHHEQFDGNGYPYGLKGEQINKGARLLAITDCFDALTSWRTHRCEYSSQEAVKKMRRMTGVFDPKMLHDFVSTGLCKEH